MNTKQSERIELNKGYYVIDLGHDGWWLCDPERTGLHKFDDEAEARDFANAMRPVEASPLPGDEEWAEKMGECLTVCLGNTVIDSEKATLVMAAHREQATAPLREALWTAEQAIEKCIADFDGGEDAGYAVAGLRDVKPQYAVIAKQANSKWQPIQTAPNATNGDDLPVWVIGGRYTKPTLTLPDGDWWRAATQQGLITNAPTHWMPLEVPAAHPTKAESQEVVAARVAQLEAEADKIPAAIRKIQDLMTTWRLAEPGDEAGVAHAKVMEAINEYADICEECRAIRDTIMGATKTESPELFPGTREALDGLSVVKAEQEGK